MSTSADATSPTTSLANHAYEILRHRLIMLDIAPGDPINEAALSAELEVGRTPIREALQRHHRDLSPDGFRTHPEIRSVYR